MESSIKVNLNSKQEEYKDEVVKSFINSCKEAGMKEEIINHLASIVELSFLDGVICERTLKEICYN